MNYVEIEYHVSETEKEIYGFSQTGNTYTYDGIMYSNRDDSGDKWGENWMVKERADELEKLDSKYEEEDLRDWEYDELYFEISRKYNPTCNKTIHGKIRHSGLSFGYSRGEEQYKPKMSYQELETAILKAISRITIKGIN